MMRFMMLLLLMICGVRSHSLNFTEFEEDVKEVSPFLGQLDRDDLTTIFTEEAARIGIPTQEHIDLCSNTVAAYLAIRNEFRSLDADKIIKIGNAANYSIQRTYEIDLDDEKVMEEEINRYINDIIQFLPVTFGILKTKRNDLRKLNVTKDVIQFVEASFSRVMERMLAEHGIFLTLRDYTFLSRDSYIKHVDEMLEEYRLYYFEENDVPILNKFTCFDILQRRISSVDGIILNVEKEIIQPPLNFTRFIEGLEVVSADYGSINRTALRIVFNEKASEIGVSPQEHVDACADIVDSYLDIRKELRNLSEVEISSIDRFLKESEDRATPLFNKYTELSLSNAQNTEERKLLWLRLENESTRVSAQLSRYLPVTSAFTETKMNELRGSNKNFAVVKFVIGITDRIIRRFLSERNFKILVLGESYGRDAFLELIEKRESRIFWTFREDSRASINKFLCYEILNGRSISSKGQLPDFEQKIIEEPLNYDPLIGQFKTLHSTFNAVDYIFFEEDLTKLASVIGISEKEYLFICTDCFTGYLKIAQEHAKIGEKESSAVKKIINTTDYRITDLTPYLPVTVDVLKAKLEEMEKVEASEKAIDFVHLVTHLIVQRNVVEQKSRIRTDCQAESILFILLKRLAEIEDRHNTLSSEDKLIVNRIFCVDFLKRKIIEGIVKWT